MSDKSIIDINSDVEASSIKQCKSILFFWADWHAPSSPKGAFDVAFRALAQSQLQQQTQDNGGAISFYRVLAESAPKLSVKHTVTTVPTFLFLHSDGSTFDRIDGGDDVARLTQIYSKFAKATCLPSSQNESPQQSPPNEDPQQKLHQRLQSLVTSSPIMLFLKGSPASPRCGFSRQAVEMLQSCNLQFGYFDILTDEEVRQGLKAFSDWPTYPQLYVRGELIGGLDIMKELIEDDDQKSLVQPLDVQDCVIGSTAGKQQQQQQTLEQRLQALTNRHRIMLFMKGIPTAPRCGFSRQIVDILDEYHVSYDAFNILQDEEVRQGLKEYSDWPTYPQLYVEGDLVGGLDIVQEMKESGDLDDLLKGGG